MPNPAGVFVPCRRLEPGTPEQISLSQLSRRNLEPIDKVPLAERGREIVERQARERQGTRTYLNIVENLPEHDKGQTRDKLAESVGVSGKKYDAAERQKETFPTNVAKKSQPLESITNQADDIHKPALSERPGRTIAHQAQTINQKEHDLQAAPIYWPIGNRLSLPGIVKSMVPGFLFFKRERLHL